MVSSFCFKQLFYPIPCLTQFELSIIGSLKAAPPEKEFLRTVTLEKSMERSQELEQEGGFYTPEEMKDILGYKQ